MAKSARQSKIIRRNIPINTARAVRQWVKDNKTSDAPPEVVRKFRKEFENAERQRK